jgi:hypothetical protein
VGETKSEASLAVKPGFRVARSTLRSLANTSAATCTQYVRRPFNVFKLGMKGIYRHCGEKHLRRHVAEFDFCYNTRSALGVND